MKLEKQAEEEVKKLQKEFGGAPKYGHQKLPPKTDFSIPQQPNDQEFEIDEDVDKLLTDLDPEAKERQKQKEQS